MSMMDMTTFEWEPGLVHAAGLRETQLPRLVARDGDR
ncbi:MAG: hypothetical protein DLM67_11725 [Candidatus Nephthysia bennettiae]|uniref:Uncharacterized protein n=1 Tax=Candidatus Nephthysia bennettiae TaxID=3127016 RepID=A0A934KCG8_9BACT|nr:hypothetical protein [Candidatus Dormibacteraeota bacterium]PZR95092.1 MAG: hypothetical protein DLM67_11725 [Candidatus Dormibacteraeota bacterium]